MEHLFFDSNSVMGVVTGCKSLVEFSVRKGRASSRILTFNLSPEVGFMAGH